MHRPVASSLFAVCLLVASSAFAEDESYTIKLYKSKKGEKIEHEKVRTTTTTVVVDAGGMAKKQETTEGDKDVYTEEILEKKAGDRRPSKLVRTYTLSETTAKGETTKTAYHGKTVLIERKGEKYEFSIKGKPLTRSDAPDLFMEFNDKEDDEPQAQDLMPTEPVKVGGTWKIPAAMSAKMFKTLSGEKMKVDPKKSTIEGKLLKAYKKDGSQFGVIELTITVFVTEMDLGGQLAKASADSKMVLKGIVDTCIDGTKKAEESKITVTFDLVSEIPNVGSVTIKGMTTGIERAHGVK